MDKKSIIGLERLDLLPEERQREILRGAGWKSTPDDDLDMWTNESENAYGLSLKAAISFEQAKRNGPGYEPDPEELAKLERRDHEFHALVGPEQLRMFVRWGDYALGEGMEMSAEESALFARMRNALDDDEGVGPRDTAKSDPPTVNSDDTLYRQVQSRAITVLRDWIHETPLSKCNMGSDECPDWPLARDVTTKIMAAIGGLIVNRNDANTPRTTASPSVPERGARVPVDATAMHARWRAERRELLEVAREYTAYDLPSGEEMGMGPLILNKTLMSEREAMQLKSPDPVMRTRAVTSIFDNVVDGRRRDPGFRDQLDLPASEEVDEATRGHIENTGPDEGVADEEPFRRAAERATRPPEGMASFRAPEAHPPLYGEPGMMGGNEVADLGPSQPAAVAAAADKSNEIADAQRLDDLNEASFFLKYWPERLVVYLDRDSSRFGAGYEFELVSWESDNELGILGRVQYQLVQAQPKNPHEIVSMHAEPSTHYCVRCGVLAGIGQSITGECSLPKDVEWKLMRFECPVADCSNAYSVADHARRDPFQTRHSHGVFCSNPIHGRDGGPQMRLSKITPLVELGS